MLKSKIEHIIENDNNKITEMYDSINGIYDNDEITSLLLEWEDLRIKIDDMVEKIIKGGTVKTYEEAYDVPLIKVKINQKHNINKKIQEKKKEIVLLNNKKLELDKMFLTTTNNIDGYKVERYISIETVEIVPGTGAVSEIFGQLSDAFGARSKMFESKMAQAKKIAFDRLKEVAYNLDGNAIIGIDIDYTEFSNNRVALVVSGTIVRVSGIINLQ